MPRRRRDCRTAREFGAEGIGLCRTEHMFFDAARITAVRQMILAEDEKGRRAALAKLLPEQRADFTQIFEIMAGLPVTIRLLDPPLHEFLPHEEDEFAEVAKAADVSVDVLKRRAAELHEFNPMLGHRGCRLGVTYPEIYEMQARAIFEAAVDVAERSGAAPIPEVMVPLVATRRELELMKAVIDKAAEAVFADKGRRIEYLVGTMIELPRAALKAGEIAEVGEFFSFGTNDLTQTTLGVSRDDAGALPRDLCRQGHLRADPFVSLDVEGVGELIEIAAERGPQDAAGHQARHLRRAWRRSGEHRLLREDRPRLCLGLALSRADRAAGGGAGGAGEIAGRATRVAPKPSPPPRRATDAAREMIPTPLGGDAAGDASRTRRGKEASIGNGHHHAPRAHHGHSGHGDHAGHGHAHAPVDFGRAFLIGITLNLGFVALEAGFGRGDRIDGAARRRRP